MHLKLVATIFALTVAVGLTAASCSKDSLPPEQQAEATAVATWLTDSGAKMYGAYWCPHCADQKEIFGNAFDEVEYIECSLPNRGGQTSACKEAGIKAYPTWEFADGTRVEAVLSLQELKEKSKFQAGPTPQTTS